MVETLLILGGASLLLSGTLHNKGLAAGASLDAINREARQIAGFVTMALGEPDTDAPDPDADVLARIEQSEAQRGGDGSLA